MGIPTDQNVEQEGDGNDEELHREAQTEVENDPEVQQLLNSRLSLLNSPKPDAAPVVAAVLDKTRSFVINETDETLVNVHLDEVPPRSQHPHHNQITPTQVSARNVLEFA